MLHCYLLTGNTSSILKMGFLTALAEKPQHANNKRESKNTRGLRGVQSFFQVLRFKTELI